MLSIKVAIIDDDPIICQKIRECLTVYCMREDVEMQTPDIYSDCESLFQAYLNGIHYDLLFLDIDFSSNGKIPDFSRNNLTPSVEKMNGLTMGMRLRRMFGCNEVDIIYVSSYERYAIDSIRIHPSAFIKKPVTQKSITQAMQDVIQYHEEHNRLFEFTCNKSPMSIQVSRIQYLNSRGRQIYIQMVDDRIAFYGKLSEVMQQECFSSFLCIHKSYLVNPDYIERYTTTQVILRGSHEALPISRTQQQHVEERLLRN